MTNIVHDLAAHAHFDSHTVEGLELEMSAAMGQDGSLLALVFQNQLIPKTGIILVGQSSRLVQVS